MLIRFHGYKLYWQPLFFHIQHKLFLIRFNATHDFALQYIINHLLPDMTVFSFRSASTGLLDVLFFCLLWAAGPSQSLQDLTSTSILGRIYKHELLSIHVPNQLLLQFFLNFSFSLLSYTIYVYMVLCSCMSSF